MKLLYDPLYGQSYFLDNKDRKILNVICDNSRMNYSKIGKITRISKDRVKERMKRMQKELFILAYLPLIDYELIGFKTFNVYIRFKSISDISESFIKNIKQEERVLSFTRLMGRYDYELKLLVKDKKELDNLLNKLKIRNNKEITSQRILPLSESYLSSMRVGKIFPKVLLKNKHRVDISLGKIDLKILMALSSDAREKTIDIAKKVGVGEDIVRYKLKKLVKNKAILGFFTWTNKHRMKLNTYAIIINLRKPSNLGEIRKFVESENIYEIKSFDHDKTLIINFYASDNKHLLSTLNKIRLNLSK